MRGKILEIKNPSEAVDIMKAIASDSRIKILELLNNNKISLNEISEKLDMPAPSVTVNIKKLEEAGLIETEYQPGNHGSLKLCKRNFDSLLIKFPGSNIDLDTNFIEMSMPIGNYKDFSVEPTCGLAKEDGYIGILDDKRSFLEPEHIYAQILWFKNGFVKYRFPNNLPVNSIIKSLELRMEICSEAPDFNKDWPSDITIWINDVEIGTWTSPGDFGGAKAKLTPEWWDDTMTQFGLLKVWSVNEDGSCIDGKHLSTKSIADLSIDDRDYIDLKIGIKENARYVGGINIFGRKFGNYEQDIILRLKYDFND